MNKLFFTLLLVFQGITLYAQNEISGVITSLQGEPLTGAVVFIPELHTGTVSDVNGNYILKGLPKGTLKIQYSFMGYNSRLETVVLTGSPLEKNIALRPSFIETQEVVVVGGYNSSQHETAVKVDVIKSGAIRNSGTPNFAESLTRIPGVDMISKGSGISKPVIRGLAMNDILVLSNGVRFENYQYSDHHPMGIDEFGIESVEVIKGPASLLYGSDAIGGVIDFVKEKPAPVGQIQGDFNTQFYSNSLGATTNLGVKGTSGKFFWGLRGGGKSNADYLQGGGTFVPNSRFNIWSMNGNAGFTGKIGSFKIFYDAGEQRLGLVEPDVVPLISERGREIEIWYQTFGNRLLSTQNKLYLGKYKIEFNAALQNANLQHYDERTDPFIEMGLSTLTYETKLYLPSSKNGEYILGFQGFDQHNKNLHGRETILLPDAVTKNYSGFTLLQYTLFKTLKVQGGGRYDHRTIETESYGDVSDPEYHPVVSNSYNSFSGSLGATYDLHDKLFFRANFSAAFRAPNLAELSSNGLHEVRYEVGNPDLLPQRALGSDLSLHYHTDHISLDLAGFYNTIKDYIFLSPTGTESADGFPVYKYHQSDAGLSGGEAVVHIHPKPLEWLHFETTLTSVTGKQANGDYLPLIPAHKLRVELRGEKKRLGLLENGFMKLSSLHAFDQNNFALEEEATPGYTLFDAGIGATVKVSNQPVELGLTLNNIFDIKYIDHLSTLKEAGYFNPGRNITFSLKIPFTMNK
jgi:iron complex outermembrane receptor protein